VASVVELGLCGCGVRRVCSLLALPVGAACARLVECARGWLCGVRGAADVRGVLKVDHLTRLETRTKEFSMVASHWEW
jgi:hypothetical protein